MIKKKRLLVVWGKGRRRILVNPKLYKKVGKIGRFVLYKKKTKAELKKLKKKVLKKSKRVLGKPNESKVVKGVKKKEREEVKKERTEEEKEIIRRIKGEKFTDSVQNKALESELLHKVSFIPVVDTKAYKKEVNPKGEVVFGPRSYANFGDLASDKSNVYKSIVMNEALKEKSSVWDNIFRLRKKIFKDGFVMKVDVYGSINRELERSDYYLGSIDISGILPDDAGFLENEFNGATGYLHEIVNLLDKIVRGRGGRGASLSTDNTKNIQVTISSVRVNYSFA